jgi:hypothetical protein
VSKMEPGGSSWKDNLGIAASALCAVHCAATPFLLACLPTLQFTEWMASPQFHQIAAIVCVALVSVSIFPAFHRHRDYRILGLSTTGLSLILGAAFLLPDNCCSVGNCIVNGESSEASLHDHAGHDHADSSSTPSRSSESELAIAGFGGANWTNVQPWMTPMGGMLLIAAHFFNMRRGFRVCQTRCDCKVLPDVVDMAASQAA